MTTTVRPVELVPLGVADIRLTRLCFGTATLFRLHASRERQRLLDAAYDLGIRHFDTARSYGLGETERELGRFLSRHRDGVTVGTKFGIQLTRTGRLFRPLQSLARRCVGLFPGLRRHLRRSASPLVAPRCFDLVTARESLKTSLAALAIERIDILFLHEPDSASTLGDELTEFFCQARDEGRIRTWGLSGPLPDILPVSRAHPALAPVLQYACDALTRASLPVPPPGPQITYAPFSQALDRIAATFEHSAAAAEAWRKELDVPRDRGTIAGLLLAESLTPPANGPVVFSTTRIDHLERLVAAAHDPAVLQRIAPLRKWIARHSPASGTG